MGKHTVIFLIVTGALVATLMWLFPGRLSGTEDQRQLVFYVALAGLVSSGVIFQYRNRMKEALTHGLIWVLIALVLVVGYSMKDTLLSALNPGRAAIDNEGRYTFPRADDGHFHIDMQINGAPVRLMVDTGASGIMLDTDSAARAGIDVGALRYTAPFSTANGRTFGAPVTLNDVEMGNQHFGQVPAHVSQEGALSGPLLGMDFLKRFRRFSVEGDRLIIEP